MAVPERWAEIDRVWHAVLARPAAERTSALDELCNGDAALRRDLESLLAHLSRASAAGFGADSAGLSLGRRSLVGSSLGPYGVHKRIGAGGMGEVFQARDSVLEREVALKILPDVWMADPDRRNRLDREARLLASLNHPNIGSIYGVQDSGAIRALVLELIEGDTLDESLARNQGPDRPAGVPITEAIDIATQILDALEAAHAQGIVHRDLKPANIKITPDRRVKVLDFGLARAVGRPADEAPASDSATDGGGPASALIGTPSYMSPEQARGRAVDQRADIWAFGCVLYEILTGTQAFGGEDVGVVLGNVVGGEPDWSRLPAATPRPVRLVLRRCLQKDPAQRFHHVADVRLALEGAFEPAADDGRRSTARARTLLVRAPALWAAGAVVIVVTLAAVVWFRRQTIPLPPVAATPPVIVNPGIGGGGTATAATIQGALDMAARGATVSVLPGTYAERLTIKRGVTLLATGERSGAAVLAPADAPEAVIEIATTDPVVIRGLTVRVTGNHGIRAVGAVDVTVERASVLAVDPQPGKQSLILVSNDSRASGARARARIARSVIDGGISKLPQGVPRSQNHAIQLVGDLDAVVESNMVRRTGAICIVVDTREDFGGQTNVDLVRNEVDECHPVARVGAIKVGSPSIALLSPKEPITATGVVNILENTIRNSSEDCLNNAIAYDVFTGRIERNRITDFVKPCATATPRNLPAAIWIGLRVTGLTKPPATPVIRFNDFQGNAHAGLRIGPDQTTAIDASCNYWGAAEGPARDSDTTGDRIVVEPGAQAPLVTSFARSPIARTATPSCR